MTLIKVVRNEKTSLKIISAKTETTENKRFAFRAKIEITTHFLEVQEITTHYHSLQV